MKKIIIIGIDGLEYDLVKKWKLKNLMQSEYGKVEVPIHPVTGVPHTVQVWSSFLTGEIQDLGLFETSNKIVSFFRFLRKKIGFGIGASKVLSKLNEVRRFPELKQSTFVDEGFSYYNIPFYDLIEIEHSGEMGKFATGKISAKELKDYSEKGYKNDKKNILDGAIKNNKFFGYTNFFDTIQHSFYNDLEYLKKCYVDIDSFIGKMKKKLDSKTFLLIISDHGADLSDGMHSDHAFYSSNKKIGLKNPHIIDFYGLIMKQLGLPNQDEKKKIKERLEKLGYI